MLVVAEVVGAIAGEMMVMGDSAVGGGAGVTASGVSTAISWLVAGGGVVG